MDDPTKPLGPVTPELAHRLGTPETWTIPRQGDRDIAMTAWELATGETTAGGSPDGPWHRGLAVTIYLTPRGNLVTSRRAWQRVQGSRTDTQESAVHETPAAALRWLIDDGKGKLGPASKQAWVAACRKYPPLASFEYERAE